MAALDQVMLPYLNASNALQEKLLQNAVDLLDDAAKVKARTIIEGMAIAKISIKLAKEMRERT